MDLIVLQKPDLFHYLSYLSMKMCGEIYLYVLGYVNLQINQDYQGAFKVFNHFSS
jgi:hypothetical protein